jgi:hypothetical protein
VAAKQSHLKPGGLSRFDVGSGQPPKPGGDAVNGAVLGDTSLDELSGGAHPIRYTRANLDSRHPIRHGNDVIDCQRSTVDRDHPQDSSFVVSRTLGHYPPGCMDQVTHRLERLARAFAIGAIVLVVVLAVIDIGEPEDPDLADAAALTAAIIGVVGLLAALRWWSTAGERTVSPERIQIGFIVRVAVAETGLLLGVVGFVMTGSLLAPMIGCALFLAALAFLVMSLRRVEP